MFQCHLYEPIKKLIEDHSSCVLFLSSSSCSVCLAVEKKLEMLEKIHTKTYFIAAKLEEVPKLSGSYLVFTIPTVLIFHRGKEIHRQSRFFQWSLLENALEESTQEKGPYK